MQRVQPFVLKKNKKDRLMSKFFSAKYAALTPYVPGEQPKDAQYIKLNTNESPFAPPASVVEAAKTEAGKLHL